MLRSCPIQTPKQDSGNGLTATQDSNKPLTRAAAVSALQQTSTRHCTACCRGSPRRPYCPCWPPGNCPAYNVHATYWSCTPSSTKPMQPAARSCSSLSLTRFCQQLPSQLLGVVSHLVTRPRQKWQGRPSRKVLRSW